MSVYAYLLGCLDTRVSPPKLAWVDVFSEENPTGPLHSRTFVIFRAVGDSFADALASLARELNGDSPFFDWILPLLSDRAIGALFGKLLPRPPRTLEQLSQVPSDEWVGLRVYHPMCQMGSTPIWRDTDNPYPDPEVENPTAWDYDLGTVTRFDPAWFAGEKWEPRAEVWFTSDGGELHYPATNLWTYRNYPRK